MALLKASPVQFKPATLHIPNEVNATWFVFWYNVNPATGKLERVKKTCNLNRIHDVKERERKGNEIAATISDALRKGWNYFTVPAVVEKQETKAAEIAEKKTITSAIAQALRIRQLGMKKRTSDSYKSFVTVFTEWLAKNNYAGLPANEFTEDIFREFLFDRSEQGFGNRNLNDYISFYKTTFDVIQKKLKLITANPISEVEFLQEHGSSLFQPLTQTEIKQIVPVLLERNPRFYLFTKFIPHEFIRPYHIARLKAGDIDYERSIIRLSAETTKNNKSVEKQLLPAMRDLLLKMEYHKLPGNYYLFGKDFQPSATLYARCSITAAEYWKAVVIDGMGIDKKMYALKHTSTQYLVQENNNFDLKFLQVHMEHHSLTQTEIYLQGKVVKKLDKSAKTLDY